APAEAPGGAAGAARYETGATGRVAPVALRVDLPSATGAAGSLLVLGAEPASELARVTLPRVAALVALELARDEAIRGAVDRARRAEPMPAAGPPWVVILARQREAGGEEDTPAGREAREAARRAIRLLAPARRMTLRGDADSLEIRAVVAGDLAEALALAERAGVLLARPVAVSRPFSTPTERPAAEGDARATLEAALALDRQPRLARADRLAIYRMLGAMHKLPDGPQLALAVLEPLLDARPDVRRERIETLRAILGHGGVGGRSRRSSVEHGRDRSREGQGHPLRPAPVHRHHGRGQGGDDPGPSARGLGPPRHLVRRFLDRGLHPDRRERPVPHARHAH